MTSCSRASCFSLMSSSFSMAIGARESVLSGCIPRLREYVLMCWELRKIAYLLSKRSPWKRQTKEIRNRIAGWCEGGGHSSSIHSHSLPAYDSNVPDDITGGQCRHIAGPCGRSITTHFVTQNLIGWWHTSVKFIIQWEVAASAEG